MNSRDPAPTPFHTASTPPQTAAPGSTPRPAPYSLRTHLAPLIPPTKLPQSPHRIVPANSKPHRLRIARVQLHGPSHPPGCLYQIPAAKHRHHPARRRVPHPLRPSRSTRSVAPHPNRQSRHNSPPPPNTPPRTADPTPPPAQIAANSPPDALGIRVTGNDASSVPEPANWLLFAGGLVFLKLFFRAKS